MGRSRGAISHNLTATWHATGGDKTAINDYQGAAGASNPSNALADDAGKVVIIRPLPVDLDAIRYAAYVRRGERALTDYVDDDSSGCSGGTNTDGPGGTPYTCVGGLVDVAK